MPENKPLQQIGNLTPKVFLERHWQKTPLLIFKGFEDFSWDLDLEEIIELSNHPLCDTRLIIKKADKYHVEYGAVNRRLLNSLPSTNWTVLVQGVNRVHSGLSKLVQKFSFIPYARLDDIMVSFAAPGGGVGPHVDSYDVFLLQGAGERVWEISTKSFIESRDRESNIKLVENFEAEGICTLEKGDLLYLPPHIAHNGIASENCITYSIGFKTPSFNNFKIRFLDFLDETVQFNDNYRDPELRPTTNSALIPRKIIDMAVGKINQIKWTRADISGLLGKFLTESNYQVEQETLETIEVSRIEFEKRLYRGRYQISPSSKILYRSNYIFFNGEQACINQPSMQEIKNIANTRSIPLLKKKYSSETVDLLYIWFKAGVIQDIKAS